MKNIPQAYRPSYLWFWPPLILGGGGSNFCRYYTRSQTGKSTGYRPTLKPLLYRGPSKDASYQISIHLAKRFQRRRFFRNQPIRNKNCLWWPCLLTDRDEMSNLYREHAIDASYQVSVHLVKRLQRRRLKNIGQSETRMAYGGHVF
jgi:hypothetical protein